MMASWTVVTSVIAAKYAEVARPSRRDASTWSFESTAASGPTETSSLLTMSITRWAKSGSIGIETSGLSSRARSASAGWLTCAAFTAFPLETSVAGQDQLDAYLPISHPERAHAALHVGGVLG